MHLLVPRSWASGRAKQEPQPQEPDGDGDHDAKAGGRQAEQQAFPDKRAGQDTPNG